MIKKIKMNIEDNQEYFGKMNSPLIACEIDEEYFAETKQRIINHTNQQKLF